MKLVPIVLGLGGFTGGDRAVLTVRHRSVKTFQEIAQLDLSHSGCGLALMGFDEFGYMARTTAFAVRG